MWTAFIIGFLGGFHCVFMCGPLVLYLRHNRAHYALRGFAMHQGGRLLGYAVLGGLAGLIGFGFSLASLQRYVALVLGGVLLYTALSSLLSIPKLTPLNRLWQNRWLSTIYTRLSSTSFFSLGLLNALLPCGLVYTALAVSAAYFDPLKGVLFMLFFGLGTLPALVLSYVLPTTWCTAKRKRFTLVLPLTTVVVGILLVLRGLSIGIPYVSPKIEQLNVAPKGNQYECVEMKKQLLGKKKPLNGA